MALLKLVKSPLKEQPKEKANLLQQGSDEEQAHEPKNIGHTTTNASELPLEADDEALHSTPAFRHHEEATSNELFYDLFFVANLTTFTNNHEVNDRNALSSYIGFFSVLWFTWYQVSLYDVRFAMDSVFDRVCKALQFGVMVGFAVIGPQYEPSAPLYQVRNFRALSLLLMGSRIVLALQYASTLWFTKRYTKTRLPLLLIIASTSIAAIMYGSITAAFPSDLKEGETSHTYIAFYIIALCETLLTTLVSSFLRIVSFKGTHLVQRMSLLTLIILGEGVIGLTKSVAIIVQNSFTFDADSVGQVISAILIIYFFYMLYFDRCETERHFGTIRQQIWAFLHFPLHLALVLVLEGVSQSLVWHEAITYSLGVIGLIIYDFEASDADNLVSALNETAWDYVFDYVPTGFNAGEFIEQVNESLEDITRVLESNATETAVQDSLKDSGANLAFPLVNTILETLGIEAPESSSGNKETPEDATEKLFAVYDLIYIYLFVAAGLVVIIMEIMGLVSRPPRTVSAWLRAAVNLGLGVALCLLSLLDLNSGAADNFLGGSWVLPLLCLVLLLAIIVVHLRHFRK